MFVDYYEVLNIPYGASFEEIKLAYRRESLKWHPDKNPNVDTTLQMQRVNEAYAILKDTSRRNRYDNEYLRFKSAQRKSSESNTGNTESSGRNGQSDTSWTYSYDINDEKVKEDVKDAREYARKLVDEFMASFRQSAKDAADGAWKAIKPYLIVIGILLALGLFFQICTSLASNNSLPEVCDVIYETVPGGWETYGFKGKYVISVPPTVELRDENDGYFQSGLGLTVFQQAGLSQLTERAKEQYCRIMILYVDGKPGDFFLKHEHALLGVEDREFIEKLVNTEIGPQSSLIGQIDYSWKSINGQKYIEANYTRSGMEYDFSIPVKCRLCLFQNGDEMVKIVLAYREKEADLWADDFQTVLNTFKWIK